VSGFAAAGWSAIEPGRRDALMLAAKRLQDAGAIVEEYELPDAFNQLHDAQPISCRPKANVFLPEYPVVYAILAPDCGEGGERARPDPEKLLAATLWRSVRPAFDGCSDVGGCDPDAESPGEAPEGLHTTGSAISSRCGLCSCAGVAPFRGRGEGTAGRGSDRGARMTDMRLLSIAQALAPAIDTDPKAAFGNLGVSGMTESV